jgi:hypothetical protein
MVTKENIERLINPHINQLLLIAETALPSNQFQAFRKIMLNEFGNNGLGKELERLFRETQNKER